MGPALRVGWAFFPLDEELGLVSGGLTPRGEEMLVRLSTWMPYESARELTSGPARDAREQSHGAPSDAGDRAGSARGVGCAGGAAQAGSARGACGSGETSDEWGWSDGASDRRRVGGSQDTGDWSGHAQSAGGGLHAASLLLLTPECCHKL